MPGIRHWFQWPALAIVNACHGANKAAERRKGCLVGDFFASVSDAVLQTAMPAMTVGQYFRPQFFSRYPVLKIHHTRTMQMARKPSVMPRLRATLTSAIS